MNAVTGAVTGFLRVLYAEAVKQRRVMYNSPLPYISALLWPVLSVTAAYYMYLPFVEQPALAARMLGGREGSLLAFIVTGYLGFTFFYSVVQTAWVNSNQERVSGTLETLFLTPASRLAVAIGNSAMGLLESVWMFLIFALVLVVATGGGRVSPVALAVSFVAILLPAVAWGTFLTALMLFARDAGLIFTVLDEPMQFFSGVRLPVSALPVWGRLLSFLFPLSFSLRAVRGLLVEGRRLAEVAPDVALLLGVTVALVTAAAAVLRISERRAKRTGSLALF